MVDEVRVLRLLRSVTDDLAVLRDEASANNQRRTDPLWLRGVKYTFVTAIEACVDVAQHICASEGWGPPRDNADAVRTLGAHGVVSRELADRLSKAVGFRNVLVHEYVDVDDRVVLARLENPFDLADFVAAVAEWTSIGR
ncbi:MAG: type VII toxin-antitoxin system HepT family RNase toxin [Pseudonocardiaceae bacterium]